MAPRVEVNDRPITFFFEGRRIGEYEVRTARAHLDAGLQNKYGELRAGVFAGRLRAKEDFGLVTTLPDYAIDQAGYAARAIFDQIDRPQFPRNGVLTTLNLYGVTSSDDPEGVYSKADALAQVAKSWGVHTLQLAGWHGDTVHGSIPAYDPFLLGGFLRGSGYRMDELFGATASLVRMVYTNRLAALRDPIGSGVYVGASLEWTRATVGVEGERSTRPSASVFIGIDTFLGPAYVAFGQALSGERPNSLYLILGTP